MKLVIAAVLTLGAVAFAAPASAQLVNGLSGGVYNGEAPIGAKSGGSPSSLKAPGEAAAIAGALRNERDSNGLRHSLKQAKVVQTRHKMARETTHARVIARNDAALRLRNSAE